MGFQSGRSKTGGRQSGTPNKTTQELRGFLNDFLEQNRGKLQDCFNKLCDKKPEQAINLYIKMSKLMLPKQKDINMRHENPAESNTIIIKEYKRGR